MDLRLRKPVETADEDQRRTGRQAPEGALLVARGAGHRVWIESPDHSTNRERRVGIAPVEESVGCGVRHRQSRPRPRGNPYETLPGVRLERDLQVQGVLSEPRRVDGGNVAPGGRHVLHLRREDLPDRLPELRPYSAFRLRESETEAQDLEELEAGGRLISV